MTRLEDQTHRLIVDLLAIYEAQGKLSYFHPVNEGKRNPRTGAHLKRLGMRKGIPDLVVMLTGGQTVFLEVKAPRKDLEPEQAAWFSRLRKAGYTCATVRSVSEAQLVVDRALGMARAA